MSKDPRDNASGPGDPGSAGGEWWDVDSASGAGRDGTAGDAAGAEGDSFVRGGRRDAGDPGARDYGAGSYDAGDYDAEDDFDDDVEDEVDDERGGRRGIWAWLAVAAVLIILFPVAVFGIAYVATDVPEPEELANDQIAVIYDKSGDNEIVRIVPEAGNRRAVELEEVPSVVRNAVLAAEDREFYTNPGFSLSGYARAA